MSAMMAVAPAKPEQKAKAADKSPFVCHGESRPGQPCQRELTAAEAWVPALAAIRKAAGRWPSKVVDLADHAHCGRCAAVGRRAGVRFYQYGPTILHMERRRAERVKLARMAFKKYL